MRLLLLFVFQVKYLSDMHCFVSCDCSNEKSMYLGDILGKKANYYFQVQKGGRILRIVLIYVSLVTIIQTFFL